MYVEVFAINLCASIALEDPVDRVLPSQVKLASPSILELEVKTAIRLAKPFEAVKAPLIADASIQLIPVPVELNT